MTSHYYVVTNIVSMIVHTHIIHRNGFNAI